MKSRAFLLILLANLAIIAVLAFALPELMIAPGKLMKGHREMEGNCFSCHSKFFGPSSEKCIECHKVPDIGKVTSKGMPILKTTSKVAFHQKLVAQECIACHADHQGVMKYRQGKQFSHALLQPAAVKQCESCHDKPRDTLHEKLSGGCAQCHSQDKWTPATFDHDKYFVLDRDHNAACSTCHLKSNFKQYTCYGCHEHTPAKIRSEHLHEGIRDYENCVECHRSGDEHEARRGRDGGSREGGRRGGHDDDD